MKVAINYDAGGFTLSLKVYKMLRYLVGERVEKPYKWIGEEENDQFIPYDFPRNDPSLIKVIEELGVESASGTSCTLKLVEIPDDIDFIICSDDDGREWIAEKHRTWN